MHFMRDSYSELPTQVVLLGGLWLLTRPGAPRPRSPCFTGLLFGATVMARIDGPLYLVAIPFALGAAVARAPARRCRRPRCERRRRGVARRRRRAHDRARARRRAAAQHRVPAAISAAASLLQYVGLALVCIVAIGIAVVRAAAGHLAGARPRADGCPTSRRSLVGARPLRARGSFARTCSTTTAYRHPYIASLQKLEQLAIDATRRYYEDSLIWHSWYLGPLALAAGIVGVALLTREVLRGRRGPIGLVVVAFLPVTAVYLGSPSIFPDQIWVMRRFLPFVIPGFILFAFVVVDRLLDVSRATARGRRVAGRVARS